MDRAKIEAFLERFVGMAAGATTIGLLAIADRSGLTGHLGDNGGGTAAEIAAAADLNERYVQEILSGLAAAGVIEYEPDTETFHLPPEHGLFLSDPSSPYFMGGWLDMIPSVFRQIDGIATAAVHGGGVGFEEFGIEIIKGIDRGNAPSQSAFLTSKWLPEVPGLVSRLEQGIRVADVGCGSGTVARLIAEEYPNSKVFGYDASERSIAVARSRADGIENLEFHTYSIKEIPSEPGFDLVTAFDVIHDLVDPLGSLEHIRDTLRPDGSFLMMEPNVSSNLEDNLHDLGTLFYGISVMHCMTQSLAKDGEGLGAAWGRQQTERYAREAGFSSFQPLEDISNRFSAFYLLQP